MKILEYCITATILCIFVYNDGEILLANHKKNITFDTIISIALLSIFTTVINLFNTEVLRGVLKIIGVYLTCSIFYKHVFKKSISDALFASLIVYLCMFVAEVITVLFASGILQLFDNSIIFMKNNLVLNSIIALITYSIVYLLRKKFVLIINSSKFKTKSSILIILTILIAISLLVFKIPLKEWKLNIEFIITMIILFCFCITAIYLLKQHSDIQKTSNMYQQVVKYSNTTNRVLEDYRMISHEHKNQLSIIRQMVPKDNKELIDYIDNLIDKRNGIKYKWVSELNRLPLEGLKGLINYKLIEISEKNINNLVTISKEVSKIKLEKLTTIQKDHLYSIIGVYIDNAIQAAEKSKTKEINIEIYKDKKDIVLIISNTYKGKIELEKLDEYGYTTKGKDHGIGLHIVKTILNEDTLFSQNRKLIGKYYVQELRIHTTQIKK